MTPPLPDPPCFTLIRSLTLLPPPPSPAVPPLLSAHDLMASDVDAIFGVSSCLPVASSLHGAVFFAAENFVIRLDIGDDSRTLFRGHTGEVEALAIEEANGRLYSVDSKLLICWDLASMKQLARVFVGESQVGQEWRVRQLYCPKGGKHLVSLERPTRSARKHAIYAVRLRDPWHSFRIVAEYSTTSHSPPSLPFFPAILAVEGLLDFFILTSHELIALSTQTVQQRVSAVRSCHCYSLTG
eukprot:757339-Hanusia_phi.AAC.3